jgi:hypothetical protein
MSPFRTIGLGLAFNQLAWLLEHNILIFKHNDKLDPISI